MANGIQLKLMEKLTSLMSQKKNANQIQMNLQFLELFLEAFYAMKFLAEKNNGLLQPERQLEAGQEDSLT